MVNQSLEMVEMHAYLPHVVALVRGMATLGTAALSCAGAADTPTWCSHASPGDPKAILAIMAVCELQRMKSSDSFWI